MLSVIFSIHNFAVLYFQCPSPNVLQHFFGKLALTHTPDPNRATTRDPNLNRPTWNTDPNPNRNRPTEQGIFLKSGTNLYS